MTRAMHSKSAMISRKLAAAKRALHGLRSRIARTKPEKTLDVQEASQLLTAVVYTVEPSHLLSSCLAAIEAQSLRPSRVEIVHNVSPVSRAAQEGLDRVQTPFYVSVDEDMMLYPDCFRRLYGLIVQSDTHAEAMMLLEDPILGRIGGVRIYRTDAVKPLGFHPLEDKGWDRLIRTKYQQAGYDLAMCMEVGGLHHPVYQPHEAFWKFRFIAEKVRYYDTGLDSFTRHVDLLIEYWTRTRDVAALYGLAGMFDGLQSADASQPLTYEGREEYPSFLKVKEFMETHQPGCGGGIEPLAEKPSNKE